MGLLWVEGLTCQLGVYSNGYEVREGVTLQLLIAKPVEQGHDYSLEHAC